MLKRSFLYLVEGLLLCAWPSLVQAQGKGQGAIVIRNTDRDGLAPIYAHEDEARIEAKAARGDSVGGITTVGLVHQYQFLHKNSRLHVIYFANQKGQFRTAWMDEADLATFTYECGCGLHRRGREEAACSPLAVSSTWNACFQEARDKKLGELKARWAQEAGGAAKSQSKLETKDEAATPPKASVEKPLTNDDVIGMVKADLGDELTIAKIKQAPAVDLDVSADALIRMKKEGASKAVIDAMMKRAAQAKAN